VALSYLRATQPVQEVRSAWPSVLWLRLCGQWARRRVIETGPSRPVSLGTRPMSRCAKWLRLVVCSVVSSTFLEMSLSIRAASCSVLDMSLSVSPSVIVVAERLERPSLARWTTPAWSEGWQQGDV
jgi:hypothetical protein